MTTIAQNRIIKYMKNIQNKKNVKHRNRGNMTISLHDSPIVPQAACQDYRAT